MNTSKISVRYAKALFLSAQEAGKLEKIFHDADLIHQVLREVPEFRETLGNPVLPEKEKIKILEHTFGPHIDELTFRFLNLLSRNNRLVYLHDMMRDFIDLYKKELGIAFATLITAVKIKEEIVKKIAEKLQEALHQEVRLSSQTDPAIIGGFILRIEDLQYDASVTSALNKYKQQLIKRN